MFYNMRKKILNGLLAVATIVAASGMFVACNDKYADELAELKGKSGGTLITVVIDNQTTTLQEALQGLQSSQNQNKVDLEKAKNDLQDQIDALKQLQEQCRDNCKAEFEKVWDAINANKDAIAALKDQVAALQAKDVELQEAIDAINETLETVKSDVASNSEKIAKLQSTMTEVLERLSAVETLAKKAENDAATAQQAADAAKQAADAAQQAADAAQQAADKAQGDATQALQDAADAKTAADAAKQAADNAQTTANEAKTLAEKNEEDIANLTTTVNDIKNEITTINTQITQLQTDVAAAQAQADAALALAQADSVLIDEINEKFENYYTKDEVETMMDDLRAEIAAAQAMAEAARAAGEAARALAQTAYSTAMAALSDAATAQATADAAQQAADAAQAAADAAQAAADNAQATADTAKDLADAAQAAADAAQAAADNAQATADAAQAAADAAQATADEALAKANENAATIATLSEKLDSVMNDHQDQLDDLKETVEDLQDQIDDICDRLDLVEQDVEDLRSDLNNMLTSILIQGTYNPVIGTFNLPTGTNTTILCALYGRNAGASMAWPEDAQLGDGTYPFDPSVIGAIDNIDLVNGDTFVSDGDQGFAGKVYMTVNPNTVDLSNVTFTLVNSQDEASPIVLNAPVPSDEVLSFGWTRAASNGFYEAEGYVDVDKVQSCKVTKNIDVEALKDLAKDALSGLQEKSLNISNAYKIIEENISAVLPAYGVKATWADTQGEEHSVYSNYNLAATTIKPLSFDFLKGKSLDKIPTISPIEFDVDFYLDYPTYNYIDYPSLNLQVYVVSDVMYGNKVVVGVYVNKADADAYCAEHPDAVVEARKFDVAGLNDFIDQINDEIIGKLTKDIETLEHQIVDQTQKNVNKALSDVNDKVITRVNNIINKVNARLTDLNHYLQPVMLYAGESSWYTVSNVWYAPTPVWTGDGGMLLEPTSLTAEMFAPAYRKYVAVTNVWDAEDPTVSAVNGDATCKAALEAANGGMNMKTILSGRVDCLLETKASYKGLVFEVTYAALDYSGKTAFSHSYLRFK